MAKVLLIDDETVNTQLYANKLESNGHEAVIAQDGDEARSHFKEKFDFILLDLMVPKGDGISLLEKIRSGINSKTPVLIFTNLISEEAKQQCMEKGATEVLFKVEYTPQKLMDKLGEYLGRAKPQEETEKAEDSAKPIVDEPADKEV